MLIAERFLSLRFGQDSLDTILYQQIGEHDTQWLVDS
jgi:hypothetical protein